MTPYSVLWISVVRRTGPSAGQVGEGPTTRGMAFGSAIRSTVEPQLQATVRCLHFVPGTRLKYKPFTLPHSNTAGTMREHRARGHITSRRSTSRMCAILTETNSHVSTTSTTLTLQLTDATLAANRK